jgi:diguanylate cyclase (GGDEF)-like protein
MSPQRSPVNGVPGSHHRWRAGIRWLMLLLLFRMSAVAAVGSDPWEPFETPWFRMVGVNEGLPHSVTTALAQDRRGLVWIGTMAGLIRYDGYRMQLFDAAGDGDTQLPDGYVRCLLSLPDGGLLIGTNYGGLARFHPDSNTFSVYPVGANGTSDRKIYGLADDRAGGVWIATDLGLDHLDLDTQSIRHVDTGPGTAPRNFSVMQDRKGNLWLGNNNGLFVRYAGSSGFVRPKHPDGIVDTVLTNQIWAIHEDAAGRLWAGSGQAGAVYLDTDGSWHSVPGFSGYDASGRQATVRDFVEAAPGIMWIATDGGGIVRYSPGNAHTTLIVHDAAMSSTLPGDSVRALLRDRSGNIWVATDLGAARNDPNARTAFTLQSSPLNGRALSDGDVHAVHVDSRQRIWLGLGGGHIDLIDLHEGSMRHLHLTGSQTNRDVQAFAETADGSIWVGTLGLARVNPDTLAITDSVVPQIDNQPVLSLCRAGQYLLIGTYDGVFRYDTKTHRLDHFQHDPRDPTSLASDTVREIARVGTSYWYGTTSGISIAGSPSLDKGFINLKHRPDDDSSLPQDYVGAIRTDARSRVWVSTYGGLGVLERDDGTEPFRFRTIGTAQGLTSNKLNTVLPDDNGDLWASMSVGIATIDGRTGKVRNLGARDGLHIPSYLFIAAARAPDGSLLFGGLGGLTVIRPDQHAAASAASTTLAVTSARINGVPLPFGTLPQDGSTISLNRQGRSMELGFALLDYRAPLETRYSYHLQGLDENWTEIPAGSPPTAIYTNLPSGNYTLHLRASIRGMQPATIETTLAIVVMPQWYETILSRIIAALLVLLAVVGLVHLRTLYLKRHAKRLQREIGEQTHDLQVANRRLKELAGTDGLTGAYNRRRFMELAEAEAAQRPSICITLFDLDRFKQVNDTYGHLAGDAVIRRAIEVIKVHCRHGDLVGRYGGEEFVLCLPDTDLQQAIETTERIREALAGTLVTHDLRSIPVTISAGIAALKDGESFEQCLARADQALYEAKRKGRNCCVTAS